MTYIRVVNSKLLYVLSSCVLLALLSCGWLTGPDDDVDPRKRLGPFLALSIGILIMLLITRI